MLATFNECRLELILGDITDQEVDAIVNAANSDLAGGGGVDGAIHHVGGPLLMNQTDTRYPEGCPTGSAVMTDAGNLKAKYVYHAVGPIWEGGREGEPELLATAYRRCLELAIEHRCGSIAFPAISTGIYGYPLDLAAEQSLSTVIDFFVTRGGPALVRFVLFDRGAFGAFAHALETRLTTGYGTE